MKILEVISDTNIGGAGILLATRCECMNRSKYEITVAIPKGSKLSKRLNDIGVAVVEVDACRDRSFEWGGILKWIRLIRKVRPMLINCHGCLSCRIAARLCSVPVLVDTRHCAFLTKRWQRVFPGKQLLGMGRRMLSDQTIAVAVAAKENLLEMGAPSKKIQVIINGAKPMRTLSEEEKRWQRKALNIPQNAVVVGIFARLEPCKGHETFLRAAQILTKKQGNYCFLIVGDGSLSRTLRERVEKLELTEAIRFVGFAEDVAPYLNVTDIQVNCSVGTETSSLALSEGMSLGIPAVASNFGGNPYMIRDGENGFLFPIDRYDILAQRIFQIGEDPELYDHLSQGAKHRFEEELNVERMTRETEALYDYLLIKAKRRRRCPKGT